MYSEAEDLYEKRRFAKKKLKLQTANPNENTNNLLITWSKPRILRLLDMSIRSHILKHTCFVLLKKGGEAPTPQIVYQMQDFGYESVDTVTKFVHYINKINLRYDLPISFHFNNRYIRFDAEKM